MKLDVAQALRNPGQEYPLRVVQTIAPQDIMGDTVTFDDAVISGVYEAGEDQSVTVTGHLSTVAHAPCALCLAPASAVIEEDFRETFVRDGDPEDDEIFSYSGSRLELEKLAMSYAVLALPMRFICKEGCKGFTGVVSEDNYSCGKDVQEERPFDALKQLLTPEFMQQFDGGEDTTSASPSSGVKH